MILRILSYLAKSTLYSSHCKFTTWPKSSSTRLLMHWPREERDLNHSTGSLTRSKRNRDSRLNPDDNDTHLYYKEVNSKRLDNSLLHAPHFSRPRAHHREIKIHSSILKSRPVLTYTLTKGRRDIATFRSPSSNRNLSIKTPSIRLGDFQTERLSYTKQRQRKCSTYRY